MKLRPNCPTRRLCHFLETFLKPYLKHVKSYICDSIDFLNKCLREVDSNIDMVTFDVTSFPLAFRINMTQGYFLTTFKEEMNSRFTNQFILNAEDFILKNDSLTFDSMFFLKLKGQSSYLIIKILQWPIKNFKFISSSKTLII